MAEFEQRQGNFIFRSVRLTIVTIVQTFEYKKKIKKFRVNYRALCTIRAGYNTSCKAPNLLNII